MKSKRPEDIARARELLRKYEQTRDHQERTRYFADALEILDQLVKESALDEKMTLLADNIKKSHLKKMVESLQSFGSIEIWDWFSYIVLLHKYKDEVDVICSKHEQLKGNYDNFVNLWGEELLAMLDKSKGS